MTQSEAGGGVRQEERKLGREGEGNERAMLWHRLAGRESVVGGSRAAKDGLGKGRQTATKTGRCTR